MKIYFLPIETDWAIKAGFQESWRNFLLGLPRDGPEYSIVDDPSLADFIISTTDTPITGRSFRETMKPLEKIDIEQFTWNIFDHPDGRMSGFYCSLPRNLFDPCRHTSISYPGPFNDEIEYFPLSDAIFDFSFVGQRSSRVRSHLFDILGNVSGLNAILRDSGRTVWAAIDGVGSQADIDRAKADYADCIRQSKFVLCPRGFGTGSIRLFEVMQAGRVPIILSDDYVKPASLDWDSFSLTIAESRVADIPSIVARKMPEWEVMALKAREAWLDNFSPPKVMEYFAANLVRMSREIEAGNVSRFGYGARAGLAYLRFKASRTAISLLSSLGGK